MNGVFPPDIARRIELTVSCHDADSLPRVEGAGELRDLEDGSVQVMHNGVLIEKDSYCGEWMTEIIRRLRGCHEPQEELVLAGILERIRSEPAPAMIELGSYWAYYSLWFLNVVPGGTVVALEPDPAFLEVGRRNFALNRQTATFVHGAVGPLPGGELTFQAASDAGYHQVRQYDLDALMGLGGLDGVSLLLADIQGAETALVDQLPAAVQAGRLRFVVISTHHHLITGDPTTHQRVLGALLNLGGHLIAEHSVGESFSGDGLVAVSFDPRDRDLVVEVSRARQRDSLFGELEPDLHRAFERALQAEAAAGGLAEENAHLRAGLDDARRELSAARSQVSAIHASKLWRWSRLPREGYARLRDRGGRRA